ncbi:DNA starvation/stationary phase protection protein Dps [Myxococcus stipitatus]|uniref:DNA starvation/stationary phase protection protein Dps n=1 Tax=Myxococcus stipitatus TaxID=83455 RepID=UPI001F1E5D36|nr:DNA starvation/stationary phase protection protein Dps [Myxococcus stipitatus]MCE9673128.1 DNA starvation/stationary phase protection protein Dps [Myxococcus stipitatus]
MNFPSHVNVPAETREEIIDLLNTLLADAIDLHWQIKQAHWNIRGTHFYSRHLLFDDLAKHARKQADDFAERAGTLGGYAEGTIRLAAKNSELPEYDLKAVESEDHLRALVDRMARYAASIRNGIQRCDELNEPITVDLLTQVLGDVELDLWFLESHLNGTGRPVARKGGREDARGEPSRTPHA